MQAINTECNSPTSDDYKFAVSNIVFCQVVLLKVRNRNRR